MPTAKRITLTDIADAIGISKITVSRAFTHPEKLNPKTLKMILSTANQLGYKVSRNAQFFKATRNKTIGIVNSNMGNPFFSVITKFIAVLARKQGYSTLVFDSYESEEIENQAINELIDYGVDGIILSVISSDMYYSPIYLEKLNMNKMPVVLLDRELASVNYDGVYIDNMDSGYQLGITIKQTMKQSEQIVIIAGVEHSRVSQERISGLRAALFEHNLSIYHTDFALELAYQKTCTLLETDKPTILVGLNNQITLGIIKACIEKGLTPNQDISVYSIDEIPYAGVYGIKIPCIAHNLQEIAFQTVNILTRRINNERDQNPHLQSKIMIRGNLIP